MAEEQFGPVLPVLTYAISTRPWPGPTPATFAWARRCGPATRTARLHRRPLQAGTVWVNQHPMLSPDVPFGGVKQSGLGVESSLYGLLGYTDISVLRVKR